MVEHFSSNAGRSVVLPALPHEDQRLRAPGCSLALPYPHEVPQSQTVRDQAVWSDGHAHSRTRPGSGLAPLL